jgi:SNF2 family DNA or RNA helicase
VRILGTKNMNELATRMQPYQLRQPIDECDLPPLRFGTVPLDRTMLDWDEEAYAEALRSAGLDGWGSLDPDEFDELIYEQRLHLSTLRALLAKAKAPRIAALAAEELENGRGKLVIFSWHLGAIERIRLHLEAFGVLTLTGATAADARARHVEMFQTMPRYKVFLAQGDAGGLGITLHAANEVWFVDSPWTPSSLLQAAKRLHRIGQRHPVLARVFTAADTVDDAVIATIMRKSRMISSLQPDAAEGALINAF